MLRIIPLNGSRQFSTLEIRLRHESMHMPTIFIVLDHLCENIALTASTNASDHWFIVTNKQIPRNDVDFICTNLWGKIFIQLVGEVPLIEIDRVKKRLGVFRQSFESCKKISIPMTSLGYLCSEQFEILMKTHQL